MTIPTVNTPQALNPTAWGRERSERTPGRKPSKRSYPERVAHTGPGKSTRGLVDPLRGTPNSRLHSWGALAVLATPGYGVKPLRGKRGTALGRGGPAV
jgi:hypothetical protein